MIGTIMTRARPYIPYLPFAAVAVVMIAVVVFVLIRVARPAQPPLVYTQTEYEAERPIYAPGEMLTYTATLTIKRAGAIDLIRGWRSRPGAARVRLCSGENAPIIRDTPPPFPGSSVNSEVEGRVSVQVPDLPPGDYWLVSAVSKHDGGESLTQVGFSVIKPCG